MALADRRKNSERRCIPHETGKCSFAEESAERSAEKAVKHTFAILGVDIDDPEQVQEFQNNLQFSAGIRKAVKQSWLAFWWGMGISIAAGMVFMIKKYMGV